MKPKELCVKISERLKNKHIGIFKGHDKPLFLISEHYAGVWLEHVYDSVFYALMNPDEIELAENTINIFIENQSESGQLPCYILDGNKKNCSLEQCIGYTQIQECVSFAKLCLMTFELNKDIGFLKKAYFACKKWENWLSNTRMTLIQDLLKCLSVLTRAMITAVGCKDFRAKVSIFCQTVLRPMPKYYRRMKKLLP